MTNPSMFSLIIIVKNRENHLRNVLRGVGHARTLPHEIIVVRMNEPARKLVGPCPVRQIELTDDASLLPLARARNAGAANTTTQTLVFLDVDCIPEIDCFMTLLNDLPDNEVRMVDPLYLKTPVDSLDMNAVRADASKNPSRQSVAYGHSRAYELFWSLGFALRAETFERIGGFDEDYLGYGGEDTDFAFTMREKHVGLFFSKARVYHQPHESVSPPLNWLEDIVANARVFKRKWGIWPMTGWLDAFARDGYIEYDETSIRVIKLPNLDKLSRTLITE